MAELHARRIHEALDAIKQQETLCREQHIPIHPDLAAWATKHSTPADEAEKMAKRPGATASPDEATQRRVGFIFAPGMR